MLKVRQLKAFRPFGLEREGGASPLVLVGGVLTSQAGNTCPAPVAFVVCGEERVAFVLPL
jgi:hypothetical protein